MNPERDKPGNTVGTRSSTDEAAASALLKHLHEKIVDQEKQLEDCQNDLQQCRKDGNQMGIQLMEKIIRQVKKSITDDKLELQRNKYLQIVKSDTVKDADLPFDSSMTNFQNVHDILDKNSKNASETPTDNDSYVNDDDSLQIISSPQGKHHETKIVTREIASLSKNLSDVKKAPKRSKMPKDSNATNGNTGDNGILKVPSNIQATPQNKPIKEQLPVIRKRQASTPKKAATSSKKLKFNASDEACYSAHEGKNPLIFQGGQEIEEPIHENTSSNPDLHANGASNESEISNNNDEARNDLECDPDDVSVGSSNEKDPDWNEKMDVSIADSSKPGPSSSIKRKLQSKSAREHFNFAGKSIKSPKPSNSNKQRIHLYDVNALNESDKDGEGGEEHDSSMENQSKAISIIVNDAPRYRGDPPDPSSYTYFCKLENVKFDKNGKLWVNGHEYRCEATDKKNIFACKGCINMQRRNLEKKENKKNLKLVRVKVLKEKEKISIIGPQKIGHICMKEDGSPIIPFQQKQLQSLDKEILHELKVDENGHIVHGDKTFIRRGKYGDNHTHSCRKCVSHKRKYRIKVVLDRIYVSKLDGLIRGDPEYYHICDGKSQKLVTTTADLNDTFVCEEQTPSDDKSSQGSPIPRKEEKTLDLNDDVVFPEIGEEHDNAKKEEDKGEESASEEDNPESDLAHIIASLKESHSSLSEVESVSENNGIDFDTREINGLQSNKESELFHTDSNGGSFLDEMDKESGSRDSGVEPQTSSIKVIPDDSPISKRRRINPDPSNFKYLCNLENVKIDEDGMLWVNGHEYRAERKGDITHFCKNCSNTNARNRRKGDQPCRLVSIIVSNEDGNITVRGPKKVGHICMNEDGSSVIPFENSKTFIMEKEVIHVMKVNEIGEIYHGDYVFVQRTDCTQNNTYMCRSCLYEYNEKDKRVPDKIYVSNLDGLIRGDPEYHHTCDGKIQKLDTNDTNYDLHENEAEEYYRSSRVLLKTIPKLPIIEDYETNADGTLLIHGHVFRPCKRQCNEEQATAYTCRKCYNKYNSYRSHFQLPGKIWMLHATGAVHGHPLKPFGREHICESKDYGYYNDLYDKHDEALFKKENDRVFTKEEFLKELNNPKTIYLQLIHLLEILKPHSTGSYHEVYAIFTRRRGTIREMFESIVWIGETFDLIVRANTHKSQKLKNLIKEKNCWILPLLVCNNTIDVCKLLEALLLDIISKNEFPVAPKQLYNTEREKIHDEELRKWMFNADHEYDVEHVRMRNGLVQLIHAAIRMDNFVSVQDVPRSAQNKVRTKYFTGAFLPFGGSKTLES